MIHDPQLNGPVATTLANENTDTAPTRRRRKPTKKATPRPRPDHYKVICISMYTADLERLADKVAQLKRRGKTKMNKSEVIRLALAQFNIEEVA